MGVCLLLFTPVYSLSPFSCLTTLTFINFYYSTIDLTQICPIHRKATILFTQHGFPVLELNFSAIKFPWSFSLKLNMTFLSFVCITLDYTSTFYLFLLQAIWENQNTVRVPYDCYHNKLAICSCDQQIEEDTQTISDTTPSTHDIFSHPLCAIYDNPKTQDEAMIAK